MWNWANYLQQYALCRRLVRGEAYMLNCLSSRDGAELSIRPSLWSLIQFRSQSKALKIPFMFITFPVSHFITSELKLTG